MLDVIHQGNAKATGRYFTPTRMDIRWTNKARQGRRGCGEVGTSHTADGKVKW